MDLIIAIKEERAFICKPSTKENGDDLMDRLVEEGADSAEEVFTFKRGDTVVDDDDNPHKVVDIHAPMNASSYTEWIYTDENGIRHNIVGIKGTLIKEVPKYHIDALLS